MTIRDQELAKYEALWSSGEYAEFSPGARYAPMFVQMVKPTAGSAILDVGAGGGAGTKALLALGFDVEGFDLTRVGFSCDGIPIRTGTIWRDLRRIRRGVFDHTYCCDVLEHIPTELTGLSISEILRVAESAFFSISFEPDVCGAIIGKPLHLTIREFSWWVDLMREIGTLVDARDLIGEGLFYVRS